MSSSHSKTHEPNEMSNGFVRLVIVICLALLASLIWNACGKSLHTAGHGDGHGGGHTTSPVSGNEAIKKAAAASAIPAGKLDAITGDYLYDAGKVITIELPGNAGKLEVGENSTENKLYKFLTDKSQSIDTVKGNWFELTNVRFKKGGMSIDSSSFVQINNIATISKAFPSAQFKIGGYTDNTGDSTNNIILSQRRADAVLGELKKAGVSSAALTGSKGYGAEHPLGDNATPEGRALNRRVAVNVKAK